MQYETKHKTYEPCIFFMKSSVARDVVWLLIFFHGVGIPACWIASSSGCIVWACLSFDPEVHYLQIICVGFATSFDASMFRFFFVCCLFPMHFFGATLCLWFLGVDFVPGKFLDATIFRFFVPVLFEERVLMPLFSDVLVLLLFHYGFWKPVFSDFVVLFFSKAFLLMQLFFVFCR